MSLKRSRKDATAAEKLEVLERFNKLPPNISERKAAEMLNVKRGFLRRVIQSQATIRAEASEQLGNQRKRHRAGKNKNVEDCLYEWYKFAKSKGALVNGPLLRLKSEHLAHQMGYDDFVVTDGWLNRWKTRYGLQWLSKTYGESKESDQKAANDWVKNNVSKFIEEYGRDNIYNADETGFYFRALPHFTYVEKNKVPFERDIETAKEHLTLLVCSNMAGAKQKLLVIGQLNKPRCFENIKAFPTDYDSSQDGRMTLEIWTKWLKRWDFQLGIEKRKILLLVDNCSAHGYVPLKQIRLVFLPPNTMSLIQPCEIGIIRALKAHVRYEIHSRIVQKVDVLAEDTKMPNELAEEITVLDAMHILAESWAKVTVMCIQNCWRKANFKAGDDVEYAEDDGLPPTPVGMTQDNFLKWVDIDNDIEIASEQTSEEREQETTTNAPKQQPEIVAEAVKTDMELETSNPAPQNAALNAESNVELNTSNPNPVPVPQNAEMRLMLDQLRAGLQVKGFPLMEEYDSIAGKICDFLQKDLAQRHATEVFASETIKPK